MKISVALCTYNGEKYLGKQLDSILQQSQPVHEIVVCDDVSSDSTMEILKGYDDKYPGIFKIHRNESNLRSNKNFEKAALLCTGDYIFFSDQDDIWREDKVEKTMQVFKDNPSAEGVFSNAALIDGEGNEIPSKGLWHSVRFYEDEYEERPVDIYKIVTRTGNVVTGATLCIKKEILSFAAPFPQSKDLYHDEWMTFLLARKKTLFYTTEKLISYRLHGSQQVGVGKFDDEKRALHEYNLIQERIAASTFSDYKMLSRQYFRNYKKFTKVAQEVSSQTIVDFNALAAEYVEKFLEAERKMKQLNPILFLSRKITDKIKGKRKL